MALTREQANSGNVHPTAESYFKSVGPFQRATDPILFAGTRLQAILVGFWCEVKFKNP